MRRFVQITALLLIPATWTDVVAAGNGAPPDRSWRALPLAKDGQVDRSWTHIGWGGFVVVEDGLRTECDERGMGLLLYRKERFGNCQIRVVYKCKDSRSNSGVFVRIDDGILKRLGEKPAPARRNKDGKIAGGSLQEQKDAAEALQGPWYAVHHGYEVQICDAEDESHRTGSIYSLSRAAPLPRKRPGGWRTMVITLKGDRVLVDIDGKRITTFDPAGKDVRGHRKWYEPKREAKRPRAGYIGLQNHDPGDIVSFKEVSVRPLDEGR